SFCARGGASHPRALLRPPLTLRVSSGPRFGASARRREICTEPLPHGNVAVRTVIGMEQRENQLQRLLQLVESAQREGHSEDEIVKLVDDALDIDVELEAA